MFTAKDLQDVSPYNWGVLMPYKGNTDNAGIAQRQSSNFVSYRPRYHNSPSAPPPV